MSTEAARPSGPALPRCPHCRGQHAAQLLKCPDTDLPLPLEGRILHGKFRFVQQIGKGGMASVWAAVNTLVDRRVAIKLIRPEAGRNEETVARFRAEAKAAGRIGHPNVCEIIDFGLGPLGPYIVMERMWGKSLGELIAERERLDPELAVGIVRRALAGLDAAHRRGIIHRDLKPENLFIHQPESGTATVKLMDFGVSKFTDGSSGVETEHGALLGTPEYMSPEQFKGAARADERTDIWAMGIILYKALTGKSAFAGPSVAATLLMVTTDDPTPIDEHVRGVPPDLVAVVGRCLDKDPDARFQSAQELSDELESFDLHTLDGLVVVDPREQEDEEEPALPTVSVSALPGIPLLDDDDVEDDDDDSGDVEQNEDDASETSGSQADVDTLLPPTHPRISVEERRPTRPERRAWLLIGGVTVVGAGLLYMLARGPSQQHTDPAPTTRAQRVAPQADAGTPATPAGGSTTASPTASDDGAAGASSSTTGAASPSTGGDASTGGTTVQTPQGTTTAEPGTTDGDPETESSSGGSSDGGSGGQEPSGPSSRRPSGSPGDSETPPPTPPGTIRVGRYLTLDKRGPIGNHVAARNYCRNLAKQKFVGVPDWKLASPTVAKKLAAYVKKGKYWTAALWKNKAIVIGLPSKKTESRKASKSGPHALCVARWP
ncbi:MAG: protein kinase [Deltaproteobacteria bacterium]|nr:protein kinase [Deltaproteobacteria bacterium]